MNVFLVTLGCPKNTVDAEAALSLLKRAGHSVVSDPAAADALVVNSCSFLQAAWQETVDQAAELAVVKKGDPNRKLILMGCLPVHQGRDFRAALPEVDAFLPSGRHGQLPEMIDQLFSGVAGSELVKPVDHDPFAGYQSRELLTPAHTAYVKLAEGCNRTCSFCAIPVIRGPLNCRRPAAIVAEVEEHLNRGVREVNLIAQDVLSYQSDGHRLPDLVAAIAATGIDWIRIFYLHPASLSLDIVERLFEFDNVCRYLEIPIQHASDTVLSRMRRSHRSRQLETVLGGIREGWPETVVRSEVIVGFPGETEADFDVLSQFIETARFASLGIFPFSLETGTAAAALGELVPDAVKALRVEELQSQQESISFEYLTSYIGRTITVLVDRRIDREEGIFSNCKFAGRYYGQALDIDGEVYLRGNNAVPGSFVTACVVDADIHDMMAEIV
jgi:ribosomal protein S12 methylthiotransferase